MICLLYLFLDLLLLKLVVILESLSWVYIFSVLMYCESYSLQILPLKLQRFLRIFYTPFLLVYLGGKFYEERKIYFSLKDSLNCSLYNSSFFWMFCYNDPPLVQVYINMWVNCDHGSWKTNEHFHQEDDILRIVSTKNALLVTLSGKVVIITEIKENTL